jgi:hypothetical protein
LIFRFNGSNNLSTNSTSQVARGTANSSYIGRRETGNYLNAFYYGSLYYAGVPNVAQLARIEQYMAKKAGVTLP